MLQQQFEGKVHLSKSAFDKALEPQDSKYYRLSIQLSPDGFSFCIYDNKRSKYSGIESCTLQDVPNALALNNALSNFIASHQWLNRPFEQTLIIIESPVNTLIPNPLFDARHPEEYLNFNHPHQSDNIVKHDYLPLLDAENIWAVPESLINMLTTTFPAASVFHHTSSLIESLLLQNKNRDAEETVFVNIRNSWFDIIVLKGNNLLYSNSFKYQSKEDFIYFLIYVLEQLNLNPEKIDVTLLGEILKLSSIYEMTYKYVRNIRFGKRNNAYQFSYVFDDMPEHFYFNLIHLQQCGL